MYLAAAFVALHSLAGCAGQSDEDETSAGGSAQTADATQASPRREWLGLLSIDAGSALAKNADFGLRVGSYVSGIACKSSFYRGSCNILLVADAPADRYRRVLFEGETAKALRSGLGASSVTGEGWSLRCDDGTCALDAPSGLYAEWRRASEESAARRLSSAQLQTLRAEVRALP
jgi:hypothetical protein